MTSLINILGVIWVIMFLDKQRLDRFKIKPLKNYMKVAYLITLSLIISWFAIKNRELYVEDHFFEQMTVGFLMLASIILVTKSIRPGILNRWLLLCCALAFFVLAMEEISWGQRIFNWQKTDILTKVNYQDETNLHNIFNPIIHNVYSAVCLLLGYFFISLNPLKERLSGFPWWKTASPFFPSNDFAIFGLVFFEL